MLYIFIEKYVIADVQTNRKLNLPNTFTWSCSTLKPISLIACPQTYSEQGK